MPYISHAELAERPGARELAQVSSSVAQPVRDEALMDATLRAADRSRWTAEEVAAADAALKRIDDAVAEADALIDGFLIQRGYTLPLVLSPTSTGKSVLTSWCRAIARYLLNKSRVTDESKDPVVRDYRDALKMLQLLAAGKYSLGAGDPSMPQSTGMTDVRFEGAPTVFGRQQLKAFR